MAIAGLTGVSMAFADTSDIKASNNQYLFQAISTNVDYTETGNGIFGTPTGILDTENGPVPGYALSISVMKDLWLGSDYIEVEYDNSSGKTDYAGALCSTTACGAYGSYAGTSGATLINYSARYGKGYMVRNEFMLTPYAELGHHEWDRGVNYGENYTHHYFGVGALGQYSPSSRLVLSANAMIGSTFGSNIAINGAFSGALGNSSLYRVGAGVDYAFQQNLHGNVGVDYTSFSYGISAIYSCGSTCAQWEPDSKTNYTTVKIGLGYAY